MIDDTLLGMMLIFGCGAALLGMACFEIYKLGARFIHWMDRMPPVIITIIGTREQ